MRVRREGGGSEEDIIRSDQDWTRQDPGSLELELELETWSAPCESASWRKHQRSVLRLFHILGGSMSLVWKM